MAPKISSVASITLKQGAEGNTSDARRWMREHGGCRRLIRRSSNACAGILYEGQAVPVRDQSTSPAVGLTQYPATADYHGHDKLDG